MLDLARAPNRGSATHVMSNVPGTPTGCSPNGVWPMKVAARDARFPSIWNESTIAGHESKVVPMVSCGSAVQSTPSPPVLTSIFRDRSSNPGVPSSNSSAAKLG